MSGIQTWYVKQTYLVVDDRRSTIAWREAPLEVHMVNIPVTELDLDWRVWLAWEWTVTICIAQRCVQILRKVQELFQLHMHTLYLTNIQRVHVCVRVILCICFKFPLLKIIFRIILLCYGSSVVKHIIGCFRWFMEKGFYYLDAWNILDESLLCYWWFLNLPYMQLMLSSN